MEATCPYCGARVGVGEGEVVTVCPYCGTSFFTAGEGEVRHLMGGVNVSPQDAFRTVLEWAVRRPEAPDDLYEKSVLRSVRLFFLPYWVFTYRLKARYRASKGVRKRFLMLFTVVRGEDVVVEDVEETEVAVPASRGFWGSRLAELRFPPAGRVFFSMRYARRAGGYLERIDVAAGEAEKAARRAALRAYEEKLGKMAAKGLLGVDVEHVEWRLVSQPFYEVVYEYGGRGYRGFVDATSGTVAWATAPVGRVFRALSLTGGLGLMGAGAISLFAGLAAGAPVFALLSLLSLGVVGGYTLSRGLRLRTEVGRAEYSPVEEGRGEGWEKVAEMLLQELS